MLLFVLLVLIIGYLRVRYPSSALTINCMVVSLLISYVVCLALWSMAQRYPTLIPVPLSPREVRALHQDKATNVWSAEPAGTRR